MASKPTEMCVIETTGAREYKVRMKSSLFVTSTTLPSLCLSISFCHEREMDNYIPSGKSFAVVSLDHLFLVVIFWMTMLFLTPRVLRRHETHRRRGRR